MADYGLGLAQDRHDHPRCEGCDEPTWRGDLVDDWCPTCWESSEPVARLVDGVEVAL